ncbi:MAG: protein kinase [Planctomycetota bacterium]
MDRERPRILGDFKLLRELGRGGMGVVYLARQLSLAREVALKVLARDVGVDGERILRFQREASLLGRISHPHIVKVFLVGEEQGTHFLAMEYVDGTDLDQVLEARRTGRNQDLPLEFQEDFRRAAVRAARDTARALGAAHEKGIVHRDVKPSNILIDRHARVLLADFGLARDLSNQALTRSGTALGTPYYMSPEQFGSGSPEPAADVYALGSVMYECVVGRRTFEEPTAERLMSRILDEDPVPPRVIDGTIERDLETIILTCLDKDQRRRYPDGNALARDLTRFLEGEPIEASASGPVTRFVRRVRRRRTPLLLLLTVVLLAFTFLLWGWFERTSRQESRARAVIERALNSDDLPLAIELMDRFLEEHPGSDGIRFERAEMELRRKNWDAAAQDFRYLAKHSSTDATAAESGYQLAEAIAGSLKGRGFDLESPSSAGTAREAYYKSLIHQARRELEAAAASTRQALEMHPDYTEAKYSLGSVLFQLGRFEEAERYLLQYDQVRSRADVMKLLGRIDMENQKFESACVNFGRYTRAVPDDVVGWNNLAAAHARQAMVHQDRALGVQFREEKAAAFSALARARELDPEYFLVTFNDAVLHVLDREIDQAEELFQQAIGRYNALGEGDLEWGLRMWLEFPMVLSWAGAHDRALFYLETMRSAQPVVEQELRWVLAYANAQHAQGDSEEALRAVRKALAGQLKDSPELKTLLEALEERE